MSKVNIEDVLTEDQICTIIKKSTDGFGDWEVIYFDIKPAEEGICGFLGEYMKGTLLVKREHCEKKIQLFIKRVPRVNKPKSEFINNCNYFRRERLMFKLMEEMDVANGTKPWCATAYVYTDNLIVMPDLTVEGYTIRPKHETLDLPHILVTVASIARFHATFVNYENKNENERHQLRKVLQKGHLFEEPTFYDSPWLKTAAKLTVDFLQMFSVKYKKGFPDLEVVLLELYIEACNSLREYENTLNVVIHKDLWVNNIFFRYENGIPINAILIDFQCIRYGPAAFDLMIFLYLTTSHIFREQHEMQIFSHYYQIFFENLDSSAKSRIEKLGYNENNFIGWCKKSRMFAILEAISIFPFILMDPITANKVFNDPDTYEKYVNEGRSEPVLEYSNLNKMYRDRQLEVIEEFIERYALGYFKCKDVMKNNESILSTK